VGTKKKKKKKGVTLRYFHSGDSVKLRGVHYGGGEKKKKNERQNLRGKRKKKTPRPFTPRDAGDQEASPAVGKANWLTHTKGVVQGKREKETRQAMDEKKEKRQDHKPLLSS